MNYKLKTFSNFNFELDLNTVLPCELYVDVLPKTSKNSIRILWIAEPNEISHLKSDVIQNKSEFDLILTFDEDILSNCENSIKFVYGTTWVKDFDFTDDKKFCITSLIGGKSTCIGHKLRHNLADRILEISSIEVDLYNSVNTPYQSSRPMKTISNKSFKNELFYSQFHIAIENHISKNYFTEKIMDCFQTKTIPIYFGCSNIDEFFDERGIFRVNSLDEIIEVCNNLDENTYSNMKEYVENNYEMSTKYVDIKQRIIDEIQLYINYKI